MMSGSTYSIFVYILILLQNAQIVRTKDIYRQKRFTKSDICNGTSATLEPVERCPINEADIQGRLLDKKCSTYPHCQGEPLVYHCVRYEDKLVEVCAPRGLITGNCCAVFNKGVGRVVEDYNKPCSECPFKYQSADSIKYNTCIEPIAKPHTETNTDNTTPTENFQSCCNAKRSKRDATCCSKQSSSSIDEIKEIHLLIPKVESENLPTSSEKEQDFSVGTGVAIPVVIVMIACGVILLTWRNRSRLGKCSETIYDGNTPTVEIDSKGRDFARTENKTESAVNDRNPVEDPLIQS